MDDCQNGPDSIAPGVVSNLVNDLGSGAAVPDKPKPKAKTPIAEPPKPTVPTAKDAQAEFVAAVDTLAASFRTVGVRFLEMIAGTSVKRGTDVIDSILAPLEEGNGKKKGKQ